MADHSAPSDASPAPEAAKSSILPWVIVGIVASSIGAAVPFALAMLGGSPSAHATETSPDTHASQSSPSSDSHGGHAAAPAHGSAPTGNSGSNTSPMVFITYGECTVNLDEQRLNRYLRIKLVLHVRRNDESAVRTAISEKELLLRNWLVAHLSDKELDDIRGKAGQNMLRREIRDHFNATLFPDHYERIYDVLFQEFNVQ